MRRRIITKVFVPRLGHPVVGEQLESRSRGKFLQETALRQFMCRGEHILRILGIRQPRPSPPDCTVDLHRGKVTLFNLQVVIGHHLKDRGVESCVHVLSMSLDARDETPFLPRVGTP